MSSATFLKRQSVLLKPGATEAEKRVTVLVFNDQTDGISSKDLNGLAALTFNPKPAEEIFLILTDALDPQQHTWQTILKAVIVVDHLVRFGAERCVDHSWAILRRIESLAQYNSAMVKTAFGLVGGRDNGLPVRERAGPLASMLNDPSAIREARAAIQERQGAIVPDVGAADYIPKAQEQAVTSTPDARAFGSVAGTNLAAKFDLSQVISLSLSLYIYII